MIAAFSDVDTQASRLRGFWIVPARSNLVRACGGETRGGPLAAVALVAAPVLVPEAAVRGVCWRDQGCGSKHDAEDGESGKYLLHAVLPWDFGRECMSLSATCVLASAAGSGE